MIVGVLKKLDSWLRAENKEAEEIGTVKVRDVRVHIIGQSALLEVGLSIIWRALILIKSFLSYVKNIKSI